VRQVPKLGKHNRHFGFQRMSKYNDGMKKKLVKSPSGRSEAQILTFFEMALSNAGAI
jgi:hypothetical protein